MTRLLLAVSLLLGGCPKPSPTPAPPPAKVQDVPSAATLFAAHARAARLDHFTPVTQRTRLAVEMAGQQMEMVVESAPPNQLRVTMRMPGVGDVVQATDGTHGWEINPLMGPRLLEGAELVELRASADQATAHDLHAAYADARVAGREAFDGVAAWRVEASSATGAPVTLWFDAASGLQIGSRSTQRTDMGALEVTTTMRDYRDVGTWREPHTMVQQMGALASTMTVVETELGAAIDPIVPPPEIADLLREGGGTP